MSVVRAPGQQIEHGTNVSLDSEHGNEFDGRGKKHDDVCGHDSSVEVIIGGVDELRGNRQI